MNVVIIENESAAADRLTNALRQLDKDIAVVNVLTSVEAGIAYLKRLPPVDLIFAEVELTDGQSFGIFDAVRPEAPVIFVSRCPHHAIKAFRQNGVDYLLKPLNQSELEAALQKCRRMYKVRLETAAEMLSPFRPERLPGGVRVRKKRFLTRIGTRLLSVPAENVAYFYTRDKTLYIKTKNSEDLIFDKRLEEIEAEVDGHQFFRANRQFILQYDAIEKVHAWFGGKLKVQVNPLPYEDIVISRLRAAAFKRWLGE